MGEDQKNMIHKLIDNLNVDLCDEAIDVLITLSDNKGYTKSALEAVIKTEGKKGSYLYGVIDKLSSEKFGDLSDLISIQSYHIKDPITLNHKIRDQRDPISKYAYKNMVKLGMDELANNDSFKINFYLAVSLNLLLNDVDFYNSERFRKVELSEEAKKLIKIKSKLDGLCIRVLNRILLADAYPNEIYKNKISLIRKSKRPPNSSGTPYILNLDLRVFQLIAEKLIDDIIYDRKELDFLNTKLARYMKVFKGYEKYYIEDVEKFIKDGNCDIPFYKKRYEMRKNRFMKFITSEYVQQIKRKYDEVEILILIGQLTETEFDWVKYLGTPENEESDPSAEANNSDIDGN